MRITLAMQQVLRQALVEPAREFFGAEVGKAAGLPPGTVTPILDRLEAAGFLTSRYVDVGPWRAGRPRRRYYTFTPDGAEWARHELARTHRAARQAARRAAAGEWKPAQGGAP